VGRDLRGRGRVVHIGAGRQTAPRTVPRLRDRRLDREHRRGLVPVGTEEHDALPGRGVATLRLAHRAGTDPAATNRTATTSHGNLLPSQPSLYSRPSATMEANQIRPTPIVIRSRFRSATDEPPKLDDTPPPNRSDRPPPRPLCSSTSSVRMRLQTITTIEKARITRSSLTEDPGNGRCRRTRPPGGSRLRPGSRRHPVGP